MVSPAQRLGTYLYTKLHVERTHLCQRPLQYRKFRTLIDTACRTLTTGTAHCSKTPIACRTFTFGTLIRLAACRTLIAAHLQMPTMLPMTGVVSDVLIIGGADGAELFQLNPGGATQLSAAALLLPLSAMNGRSCWGSSGSKCS